MLLARMIFGTVAAVALTGPGLYAQRDSSWDRDRDGRISRDEWREDQRTFERRDRNGDGYLSGNEIPPRISRGMQSAGNADRRRNSANDGVARLDKNATGVVEGYEWPYNRRVFHDLDRDGNSVLSANELEQITSATMNQLDRNNNQRIEASEWPGGFAKFSDLDQNGDGTISSDEYFGRGADWQRRQRFGEWDANRDGIISSTEWRSRPDLFHQLDRDRDSRLSWEEFTASTERYERPFGWRYDDRR